LIDNVHNSIFYSRRILLDNFVLHLMDSLKSNISQTNIIYYSLLACYIVLAIGQYFFGVRLLNKSRNEERMFLKIKGKECIANFKLATDFVCFAQNPNSDFDIENDTDSFRIHNKKNQNEVIIQSSDLSKRDSNAEFAYTFREKFEFGIRMLISAIISLALIVTIDILNFEHRDILVTTTSMFNDTSRIEFYGFINQDYHQYF